MCSAQRVRLIKYFYALFFGTSGLIVEVNSDVDFILQYAKAPRKARLLYI
jgi:hypothetical protein